MLKISTAISDIINDNSFLYFGLHNKLFNISKLSKFIKPYIEVKTKKEVKETAILMSLLRFQSTMKKNEAKRKVFVIKNLIVNSNLCTISFAKSPSIYEKLAKLYAENQKKNHYIVLNQSIKEISLIVHDSFLPIVKKLIDEKPLYVKEGLSSIGVHFELDYMETPGLFHYLIEQISLQGINIWDVSSTFSEIIFYIDQKDATQAFEILNRLFKQNKIFK